MLDLQGQDVRSVLLPDIVQATWASSFGKELEKATWGGAGALRRILSLEVVLKILHGAAMLLKGEPTLLELLPPEDSKVIVVGDTHGQLHDILKMFNTAGEPSSTNKFVLNGDFVDRGAWGLETLLVFLVWKLAFPGSVFLLRGNHETTTCTTMYGFKGELEQKYGKPEGQAIYKACKRLFATLPLAACIGRATLVLHGGLFRKPVPAAPSRNKRKKKYAEATSCELGSLDDLRASGKGGLDPNGRGTTVVATDVLWSDPVAEAGLCLNTSRGVGVIFGPDVTQRFLEENRLRLVLRSHEGPDARFEREDMPSMQNGWTLDHETPAGNLLTVFSAPDYPQFQPEEDERYCNLAAVAVLTAPDWSTPEMLQYEAVLPRPPAVAFYDYFSVPGSDEELEIAGSEASQASLTSTLGGLDDTAAAPSQLPTNGAAQDLLQSQAHSASAGDLPSSREPADAAGQDGAPSSWPQVLPAVGSIAHEAANGSHQEPKLEINARSNHTATEPSESKPSRTSLRQQQRRANAAFNQAGPPRGQAEPRPPAQPAVQASLAVSEHEPSATQDLRGQQPSISQGEAASQIAISQEAVSEAVNAPFLTTSTTMGNGINVDSGAGPSQDITPPSDTPLGLCAVALPPGGPAALDKSILETPAPAQMVQILHPGRELEQAAAHTLALKGGVSQDTPETTMSQVLAMPGKACTPPAPPLLEEAGHSQPSHIPLPESRSAEQSMDQGEDLHGTMQPIREQVSSQGGANRPETHESSPKQVEEPTLHLNGGSHPAKQVTRGKKAAGPAEEHMPRPAKRSKAPAPWR